MLLCSNYPPSDERDAMPTALQKTYAALQGVDVTDRSGTVVVHADITMWVSPR